MGADDQPRKCPKCGYELEPWDQECPRCKRLGEAAETRARRTDQAEAGPLTPPPPPAHEGIAAPPPPGPAPAPPTYRTFNNAGFWIRVLAALIDGVLLMAVSLGIMLVAAVATGASLAALGEYVGEIGEAGGSLVMQLAQGVGGLVGVLYFVLMNGAYGATLGKMAVGIMIVRENGDPIGYGIAFLRYLVKAVLGNCTCSLMFLSVAFNPEYRGWHDQIVGTRVIYTR